jgi:hypothetical protein
MFSVFIFSGVVDLESRTLVMLVLWLLKVILLGLLFCDGFS